MKMLLAILLLQHAVISARSGLVTYVRDMTAEVDEHMGEGNEIRTNFGSRFEAMLTPDTYVRLRGSASIVLESEALDRTVLRLLRGSAIVAAKNIDPQIPIRILMGDLEFSIGKDGHYLFEVDRAVVLDGELGIHDTTGHLEDTRIRKDWSLARPEPGRDFVQVRLDDSAQFDSVPLVRWSRQRTDQLTPEPVFTRSRPGRRFRF